MTKFGFASFLLCIVCALANVQAQELVTEDFFVPARDSLSEKSSIRLFVRNKRPATMKEFSADTTLLFIHGATYPASGFFDLQFDGLSWMEYIARRGYDVYLMDLRGYGRSDRPPELSQPAEDHDPPVTTATAINEFAAVVNHILNRRGLNKLNIMGWSWGTTIAAGYTTQYADKVNKLILIAPIWLPREQLEDAMGEVHAWRAVTKEAAWNRWIRGIPKDKLEEIMPRRWFDTWWDLNMQIARIGAEQNPPVIIAPNGALHDIELWLAGTALYDPAKITVPTFIAVAEWDVDTPTAMAFDLFHKLEHAPKKRTVFIGEGTHSVLLEKNRQQLFREVQLFLDE